MAQRERRNYKTAEREEREKRQVAPNPKPETRMGGGVRLRESAMQCNVDNKYFLSYYRLGIAGHM